MSDDTINLEFIGRQLLKLNEEMRDIRKENQTILEALVVNQRAITGLDRRLSDWKDELAIMIKMELGGANANTQTRMEQEVHVQVTEVWEAIERIFESGTRSVTTVDELMGVAKKVIQEHKVKDMLSS